MTITNRRLRLKQVLEIIPVSRATIYKWVREGKFPQQEALGPRTSAWKESEVMEWLDSRGGEK